MFLCISGRKLISLGAIKSVDVGLNSIDVLNKLARTGALQEDGTATQYGIQQCKSTNFGSYNKLQVVMNVVNNHVVCVQYPTGTTFTLKSTVLELVLRTPE
jgi:hypothetical protein